MATTELTGLAWMGLWVMFTLLLANGVEPGHGNYSKVWLGWAMFTLVLAIGWKQMAMTLPGFAWLCNVYG